MTMQTPITEESGVHESWYAEAREMTLEKLPEFLNRLANSYGHDYGTICHAIAAAACAAARAMDRTDQGGITGFQGGAVMWEFIVHWDESRLGKPLRILDYAEMLFPQCKEQFTTISESTWEYLQKRANELLAEHEGTYINPSVRDHWRRIANGEVPFGFSVAGGESS